MVESSSQKVGIKIFRGAAATVLSLVATTIIGLLIMPIVVNQLGDRLYGVWVLIGTITGYFGFLDLGLSKAVMRFVSQSLGKGDKVASDDWISIALASFAILAIVSLFLSIGVWLLVPCFLPGAEDATVISLALLIALLAFSAALPARCFLGILEAHVRKDIVSLIHVLTNIFRAGTMFVVISYKGSLIGLAMVAAIYTVIDGFLIIFFARRVHGPFRLNKAALNIENLKVFFGYASSSFVTQITDIIRYKSYPMIITPFLGLAALTPFAIAERLTQLLVSLCNGILLNLSPVFSQLEGEGGVEGNEKLKRYYFFSYKFSCYLGVFAVGMTMMLASPFIERWMGAKYLNAVPILHVLLIGIFFSLIQIPTLCFLFAVSRHKFYAITNTIHSVASIILCLILIIPFELLGLAFSISFVTFFVKFFLQPIGVLGLFDMKLINYHIKKSLPNIIVPSIFIILYYFFTKKYIQPDYSIIFLIGLFGSLFFTLYICVCGFNKCERSMLLRAIKPALVFLK